MMVIPLRRPLALLWTVLFVTTGSLTTAYLPAAAEATHSLTRTSCASIAEKKRIFKGTKNAWCARSSASQEALCAARDARWSEVILPVRTGRP